MVLERFRKHMAIIFWIVAIAFVVMFGWSQLWDSLASIIGRERTQNVDEVLKDTAFVVRGKETPYVFYELEVAREAASIQNRGQYIGEKERDAIAERVFLSMALDEVLRNRAATAGFSLSENYLRLISDTLSFYDRFHAQQRMISEKDFLSMIETRETAKQLKAFMGLSAWISPVQAILRMRIQTDKYTSEYAFFKTRDIQPDRTIDDSTLLSSFESLRAKGYTVLPSRAVVKYIEIAYGPQEDDWLRTERKTVNLMQRFQGLQGDSLKTVFSNLAQQYSEDYNTASSGGYLGWIGKNSNIDKSFIDSAFAVDSGSVVGPVRTVWGWHVIQVSNRTEDSVEVSHILLQVKGDPERDQRSLDLMTRIMEDSKFLSLDSIAVLFSLELKESKPFDRWGKYPPEFSFIQSAVNFAFSADSGEIGGPYIGSDNITVIQTVKKLPPSEIPFEELRGWLTDSLLRETGNEICLQNALRCSELIREGKDLSSSVSSSGGDYYSPLTHVFYDDLENSPAGGVVQMTGLTAQEPGYYGPIKGSGGYYIVHLIEKETLSDSLIQNDLPAYWFNLSLVRGREFMSQWSACVLEKAFSTGEIRDLRYKLNGSGE
ncbi:peptidylprolyl isomerase [candidate division WOR-3 bacterium]|nr:peptidylprolyl isomerase [candidate division WOR-3 bacterium]